MEIGTSILLVLAVVWMFLAWFPVVMFVLRGRSSSDVLRMIDRVQYYLVLATGYITIGLGVAQVLGYVIVEEQSLVHDNPLVFLLTGAVFVLLWYFLSDHENEHW